LARFSPGGGAAPRRPPPRAPRPRKNRAGGGRCDGLGLALEHRGSRVEDDGLGQLGGMMGFAARNMGRTDCQAGALPFGVAR